MKRLVYMMMALVVLFAANSCKDKKTAQVITPTDSLDLEEVADDSTIYGVCGEGTSMHNLELLPALRMFLTMRPGMAPI